MRSIGRCERRKQKQENRSQSSSSDWMKWNEKRKKEKWLIKISTEMKLIRNAIIGQLKAKMFKWNKIAHSEQNIAYNNNNRCEEMLALFQGIGSRRTVAMETDDVCSVCVVCVFALMSFVATGHAHLWCVTHLHIAYDSAALVRCHNIYTIDINMRMV